MLERGVVVPILSRVIRDNHHLTPAKLAIVIAKELDAIEAAAILDELERDGPGAMHTKPRPCEKDAAMSQVLKTGQNNRIVFNKFVDTYPQQYTPFEIADACELGNYTGAPRCTLLKKKGLIVETGEKRKYVDVHGVSHRNAGVLALGPLGLTIMRVAIERGW